MDPAATKRTELVPVVAVGGVVIASGPKVLLVRRRTPPMVGQWTLPGGRLHGGESIAAAIEREVFEETSVRVAVGRLVEIIEIVSEGYHYVIHDHLCLPVDSDAVPRAGDDAEDARFVRIQELRTLGVTDAVARVVQAGLAMRQVLSEEE